MHNNLRDNVFREAGNLKGLRGVGLPKFVCFSSYIQFWFCKEDYFWLEILILWIARHKILRYEYMFDFIIEWKPLDDVWSCIKDNCCKQQTLRFPINHSLHFMSIFLVQFNICLKYYFFLLFHLKFIMENPMFDIWKTTKYVQCANECQWMHYVDVVCNSCAVSKIYSWMF